MRRAGLVKMLLEVDPLIVYRLNGDYESALLVACSRRHLGVVMQLMGTLGLLAAKEEGSSTSLHVAAMGGQVKK